VTQFCFLTIFPVYFLSVCYGSRHSLGSLTLAFVLALSSSAVCRPGCLARKQAPASQSASQLASSIVIYKCPQYELLAISNIGLSPELAGIGM